MTIRDNKELLGVPSDPGPVTVTGLMPMMGAGWVTCLLGDVMLMPGMNFGRNGVRNFNLAPDDGVFGGSIVENLS